tara:strand:+ start:711 stop:1532 length:822 start_codon:yes stop_codon:yes gene_type:complete
MGKMLSDGQIEGFRRDGFIYGLNALTQEEAAECRRCLEEYETRTGQSAQESLTLKSHLPFGLFSRLIRHDKVLDAVEDLIGPNIFCWGSSFFVKEPHSEAYVSWHADTYYYGIEPQETVTAWIAFTPANLVSGCIRAIPGSHLAKSDFENAPDPNNILKRGQRTRDVDESKAVYMPLEPGQFSIHHECTVHSSEPNRSDDRRIGYSIHYCPTHARETMYDPVDGRKSAALVRGVDEYNYWDHEPMTEVDYDPAMAAHMVEIRRQFMSRNKGRA